MLITDDKLPDDVVRRQYAGTKQALLLPQLWI
jgi:hypothetical protein